MKVCSGAVRMLKCQLTSACNTPLNWSDLKVTWFIISAGQRQKTSAPAHVHSVLSLSSGLCSKRCRKPYHLFSHSFDFDPVPHLKTEGKDLRSPPLTHWLQCAIRQVPRKTKSPEKGVGQFRTTGSNASSP